MVALERDTRDWTIGRIGGFGLACSVGRDLTGPGCSAQLVLERTGYEQVLEMPGDLTALGLIARLGYALDRFEAELEGAVRRRADASARLADYEPRLGERFPLHAELEDKLARMAELETELGKIESIIAQDAPNSASAEAEAEAA